jgi:hypothetical protein
MTLTFKDEKKNSEKIKRSKQSYFNEIKREW